LKTPRQSIDLPSQLLVRDKTRLEHEHIEIVRIKKYKGNYRTKTGGRYSVGQFEGK
jgi:hypothetical protein